MLSWKLLFDSSSDNYMYLFLYFSPTPGVSRKGSLERISSLSPAAQRLLGSRIGVRTGTDKALRESYSPSPGHRLPGYKTPNLTPKLTPKSKTPSNATPSGSSTPGSERSGNMSPFLTDNLLQLPRKRTITDEPSSHSQQEKRRAKATDFF